MKRAGGGLGDDDNVTKKKKKEIGFNLELNDLSERQLWYLHKRITRNVRGTKKWEAIGNGMDETDLDFSDNKIFCIRSALSLDPKGYPKNLRLPLREQKGEDGWKGNPKDQWPAAQVVLMKNGFKPDLSLYKKEDWEASHLCNHPWCVNINHLIWEHRKYNAYRKNCVTWTTCPCGCNHSYNPCIHSPKCIPMKKCTCVNHVIKNNTDF